MSGGAWTIVATADAVVLTLLMLFRRFLIHSFANETRESIFDKPGSQPDGPGTWRVFLGLALTVEAGLLTYGFVHWVA
jgi:hypothetical protein